MFASISKHRLLSHFILLLARAVVHCSSFSSMAKNLSISPSTVVASCTPSRSLIVCSLLAVWTTCQAFDAIFLGTPTVGSVSAYRSKREVPMVQLRDFEGDLDFLTSLELQHELQFACLNVSDICVHYFLWQIRTVFINLLN